MSTLYERIDLLCKERGITITEMCRRSGASRSSLTDLKKGRNNGLNSGTLNKIATFFGVSVDYLINDGEREQLHGKKNEPTDGELSKKQLMLIDFARSVPADKVDLVLRVMQSIVEVDD